LEFHDSSALMDECIFCRIVAGEIPSNVAYRDDAVVAIEDLTPQAPSHALVLPVSHYATISDLVEADASLATQLIAVASRLGAQRGGERGFRLVVNSGTDGGQTVGHVHIHVLAGRPMSWPPG
jgi:histidine triad (HIT) family protein